MVVGFIGIKSELGGFIAEVGQHIEDEGALKVVDWQRWRGHMLAGRPLSFGGVGDGSDGEPEEITSDDEQPPVAKKSKPSVADKAPVPLASLQQRIQKATTAPKPKTPAKPRKKQ